MLASGFATRLLVVGSEKLSAITDYTDRSTAVLFGDGAGAAVLTPSDGTRGILAGILKSDGRLAELLYRPGGGSLAPPSEQLLKDHGYFIKMAGREVFKSAVRSMADAADRALEQAGITGEQVDLLIPHQANIRIIEATAEHAHIPMERVFVNVDRFGNTSSAVHPPRHRRGAAVGPPQAGDDGPAGGVRGRLHLGRDPPQVVNVVLLCPGQGAQRVGMGKDLADAFPAARDAFAAIDEALGFALSRVMWEGPEELLTRTDHAQPAILAHSAAVWAVAGAGWREAWPPARDIPSGSTAPTWPPAPSVPRKRPGWCAGAGS